MNEHWQTSDWDLMDGETLLGRLTGYDVDQPRFLLRFAPTPAWEPIRPLFDAFAALRGPDPEGTAMMRVLRPIRDLGLTLVPAGGGTPLTEYILTIDGDEARLRY
ncbi:hypothetical protein G3I60_06555 [Streptomyces sp. SID13666]|uniref:hypothetical protein n=1 Tax=Streptomyces TaxID=1883 RepID=UPI001105F3D1|nr:MULTISPECIES: hypothetical protein [Streptomyces]MCZ4101877.1 hypothetical protein [Streptomyces sp. H39-C1]NEA53828.1 hypothetical protein [Streptomyces sp. SID13666]NEA76724.1 hypothetical protein [Streptomyces sp. SID13588]QNA76848.1 hypothetical protein C8250_037710 [Streptomyces sp. So13.3]